MNRDEFVALYKARHDEYAKVDARVSGALLLDYVLADFALVCQDDDDAELNLEDAAEESGYSSDHLRRLVRLGKLRAVHRGRRLYFRRADLPRKPRRKIDGLRLVGYDPRADAQRVATRTSHGGTDG